MEPLRPLIIPVLPSADIDRDIAWYEQHTGFSARWSDNMYAVLVRVPSRTPCSEDR
jgi:hypothetical protein